MSTSTGPRSIELPSTCTPTNSKAGSCTWRHYVLDDGPDGPVYRYAGKCRDIDHGPGRNPATDPEYECPPPERTR